MDYCDTNILTAFVSKEQSIRVFGKKDTKKKFKRIRSFRNIRAEEKLIKLKGCRINRKILSEDIGQHRESAGALLSSINLKNIELTNREGVKDGKRVFNKACKNINENSRFYKKFCDKKRLKLDEELAKSDLNDIRHLGSAIRTGSKKFITNNSKDFKHIKKFSPIDVEF